MNSTIRNYPKAEFVFYNRLPKAGSSTLINVIQNMAKKHRFKGMVKNAQVFRVSAFFRQTDLKNSLWGKQLKKQFKYIIVKFMGWKIS